MCVRTYHSILYMYIRTCVCVYVRMYIVVSGLCMYVLCVYTYFLQLRWYCSVMLCVCVCVYVHVDVCVFARPHNVLHLTCNHVWVH